MDTKYGHYIQITFGNAHSKKRYWLSRPRAPDQDKVAAFCNDRPFYDTEKMLTSDVMRHDDEMVILLMRNLLLSLPVLSCPLADSRNNLLYILFLSAARRLIF